MNTLVKESSSLISLAQFLGDTYYYEDKTILTMLDVINAGLFSEYSCSLIKTIHVSVIFL